MEFGSLDAILVPRLHCEHNPRAARHIHVLFDILFQHARHFFKFQVFSGGAMARREISTGVFVLRFHLANELSKSLKFHNRRSALQHPSWKLIDTNYMFDSRPGSPGAGSHSTVVNLEPAAARAR